MSPFIQQITAWSYSRLQDYKRCPRFAKFKHVMRLKEPDNPAMSRGSEVHEKAQHFTEGKLDKLPPELTHFKEQFVELKATADTRCEQEWAFTKEWEPTGWFAPNTWVRVKVDAKCTDDGVLYIIDHKTGKVNADHEDQRRLYGLAGMIMHPEVTKVIAQHWYLDHGVVHENEYLISQKGALIQYWNDKSKPMLTDTRFAPNPGNHCRWCFFSKANKGPCEY